VLSSIYRTLRERQTLFTSVIMRGRSDRMQAAIDEHERILATLRGDDRDAFCTAVNDHLQWSIALARESQQTGPATSASPA
jgi:DNA-binding GntR family transcriptional regulator